MTIWLVCSISVFGQSKKKWENTKVLNTIEGYENFIQKYPEGEYTELAKQCIEQLEFQNAKKLNTIQAYEDFLSKHGQSRFSTDAEALINELKTKNDWQAAIIENTVSGFEIYIRNHPDAKNIGVAKLNLENLEWQNSKSLNTVSGYEQFITKYPQSTYLSEAKTNLEALEWNSAQTLGTVDALKSFLTKYPQSSYAKDAKATLNEITTPPLVKAAKQNDIEKVKSLLSNKENVNADNQGGPSALMYASVNNNLELVKLLVSKGADINYQTSSESAIYVSDFGNYYKDNKDFHLDIVEYLISSALKYESYPSPTIKEIRDLVWNVVTEAKENYGGVGIEILTASRNQTDKNIIEITGEVASWSGSSVMYHLGRWHIYISPDGTKWKATGKRIN